MYEMHLKDVLLYKNGTYSFFLNNLFFSKQQFCINTAPIRSSKILANFEEKIGCGRSLVQMISPSLFRKAFQILSSLSDQWGSNRIQST